MLRFHNDLKSTPKFLKQSPSFRFPHQNSLCIPMSHIHRSFHPPLFDHVYLVRSSHCEVLHCGCLCFPGNFSEVQIQGDQKVSVHLTIYCNHLAYRDFLITLYKELYHVIKHLDPALFRDRTING